MRRSSWLAGLALAITLTLAVPWEALARGGGHGTPPTVHPRTVAIAAKVVRLLEDQRTSGRSIPFEIASA